MTDCPAHAHYDTHRVEQSTREVVRSQATNLRMGVRWLVRRPLQRISPSHFTKLKVQSSELQEDDFTDADKERCARSSE